MDPILPDAKQILLDFLRAHPVMVELFETFPPAPGGSVSPRLGSRTTGVWPFLRVSHTSSRSSPGWYGRPVLQVDCFAEAEEQASDLCRTTVAVLGEWSGRFEAGWVKGYEVTSGPFENNSEAPEMFRYQFDVSPVTFAHSG